MQTKPKSTRKAAKAVAAVTHALNPRRFTSVVCGEQILYAGKGAVKVTIEKEIGPIKEVDK